MLTVHEVERAIPKQMKIRVSQDMVDQLNNLSSDPEAARNMRENFISYASVMKDGRFHLEDYVHAVAYVSYKIMGYNNKESYSRTFPGRYQALVAKGCSDRDISSYVAAYNKNKLVNLILEQTLIPSFVLNQDMYQQALNVQADLMLNAKSEKVRMEAANSILVQLKKPDVKKVEMSMSMVDNSGMNELKDSLSKMAEMQQQLIRDGATTKTIAHQRIIEPEDAEVIED